MTARTTPTASDFTSDQQRDPAIGGLKWAFVLVGVADATLLPFLPLYLFERGFDAPLIGVVLAAAALASLVAGLGWAYLTDHGVRPERMVVVASAATAAVAVLFVLPAGVAALGAVTVALAVARSPFMLLDPIALQRLMSARRTAYARIRLRMSAGWTVSAVMSGAAFQVVGLRLIPFLYVPLVALFGLWVRHALNPVPGTPRVHLDLASTGARVPRLPLALIGFLASCLLLGAASAAAQNFVVLRINFLGGGALLIGAAAAFQALTEIPTMGYTHVLTRRLSHRALYAVGCGIFLVVFLTWAFVTDPLAVALMKLVAGVGFALTYVGMVMIADELSPPHLRATGQALVKAAMFGLSPVAGTVGGGLIYGAFGSRAMFLAATAIAGVAGLVALLAIPARNRAAQRPDVATGDINMGDGVLPGSEPAPAIP
ncbi:MAG: MFS transporter [Candidatus Dormibacteraeota bacterium]|nr:MFS transporter [Candidatus Dormibacteraeota bacterium]